MQPLEKIHEYSETVCRQIRWRKAHPIITEEIEDHLIDQRDAYIAEGADESSATDMAIAQMGDPVTVGVQLDRTHRPKTQRGMIALTIAIVCLGIAFEIYWNAPTGGHRWMFNLFIQFITGFALMAAAYFMDFTLIGKHPVIVYMLLTAVFMVLFVMYKTLDFLGCAYSLPLLFPLGFAGVVYSARNKGFLGIIMCGAAFSFPALTLLIFGGNLGRSEFILFAVSALVILCLSISKGWFKVKAFRGYLLVFIPVVVAIVVAAVYVLSDVGKLQRIQDALNPSYASVDHYGAEIKAALAGSRFIGQGILPEGTQDIGFSTFCMLTCYIYHYGWITVIPVVGLLLVFIIKSFSLCLKQKSGLAMFVSVSVIMTFTMQVMSYILFNLGFDLFSPISLPLIIQFDHIDLLINMALVGLMLSVFRTGYIVKDRNIGNISNQRTRAFALRINR